MAGTNREAMLADIVEIMDAIAPADLAESWDNVGVQIGDSKQLVNHVWVSLDPSLEVVTAACEGGADLLVTHHPLFFHPLKSIDWRSPTGRIIQMAAKSGLSIFSAHTNLDSALGGVNDVLAETIGCKQVKPLSFAVIEASEEETSAMEPGLGRFGRLNACLPLLSFAESIRQHLGLESVRMAGNPEMPVETIAVCSGSGSGLFNAFLASGADVFVTGDLGFHHGRDAESLGKGLVDIGHFASEHLIVRSLAGRLAESAKKRGFHFSVQACDIEKEPFYIV